MPVEEARQLYKKLWSLTHVWPVEISDGEMLMRMFEARTAQKKHRRYLQRAAMPPRRQVFHEDYVVVSIKEFNRQRFTGSLPSAPIGAAPQGIVHVDITGLWERADLEAEDWFLQFEVT